MGVDIYEAGSEHTAARVDDAAGGLSREISNGHDDPGSHAGVGAIPGVARAVDHAGVADEEIEIGPGEGRGEEEKDEQRLHATGPRKKFRAVAM